MVSLDHEYDILKFLAKHILLNEVYVSLIDQAIPAVRNKILVLTCS